jgi:hypothetical protein
VGVVGAALVGVDVGAVFVGVVRADDMVRVIIDWRACSDDKICLLC